MPPQRFSSSSQEWGELLFETNFLGIGTSSGHLSIKNFSDWSYRLGPKIRQREGAGRELVTIPPLSNS